MNNRALTSDLHRALHSCVVIDLETTGLDPEHERIIEIGALRIENGTVSDTFHSLINPQQPLPAFVVELTGLRDQDITAAHTISATLPALHSFLTSMDEQPMLVGHNVRFDIGFLAAEVSRTDATPWEFLELAPPLCTAETSRQLISRNEVGRYTLGNVAEHLQTAHRPSHRALDDAHATFEVLVGLADLSRRHTPPPSSLNP